MTSIADFQPDQTVDCPGWCEIHRGPKATTAEFTGSVEDVKSLGQHTASQLFHRRYPHFNPTAVEVRQLAGLWEPQIYMWHGVTGIENEPGEPPRTSRTFTVLEARALGEALLKACDLVEEILPKRCACGEPIEPRRDACVMCALETATRTRQARRARLAVVE